MDKSIFQLVIRRLCCCLWVIIVASVTMVIFYSVELDYSGKWFPVIRNTSHSPIRYPFLRQQCFEYADLGARFKCNETEYYNAYPPDAIFTCASNLWQNSRDPHKNDPWQRILTVNSSQTFDASAVSQRPNIHIAFVGDSHLRYIFEVFVRRIASPRVKYRIASFDKNKWEDSKIMYDQKRKNYHEDYHEVIHLDFPLKISFWWDRLLTEFPRLLQEWTSGQTHRPTLVVFGTALHYMEDYKSVFIKEGKEKAAEIFFRHLKLLFPIVSSFAESTTSIYKMQDHLGRDLKRATNYNWNIDYYNELATRVFSKTPVLLWDSTLPLADMYQEECRSRYKDTPKTGDWQCHDYSHIGYFMTEQYLNMLLNHLCNSIMRKTNQMNND